MIRKGRDKNAQSDRIEGETAGQQALQIGSGGVDHQISAVAQGINHLAPGSGPIHDRMVSGERAGPSGLHIARFEALVITVDKERRPLSRCSRSGRELVGTLLKTP